MASSTIVQRGAHRARQVDLERVVAIANGKGGVGKTTITSNLSGQYAAAGYNVLAIDLNHQGNMADDLGYRGVEDVDDQGAGLMAAIMTGRPLDPVHCPGRANLDLVPGGDRLGDLTSVVLGRVAELDRGAYTVLADVLAPVAGQYDLVFIDCPPENLTLQDLALTAARWVLIPTKSDTGGLLGMRSLAKRFSIARQQNPQIGLLGVVLFATTTGARAIHAEVRSSIETTFGGNSPMFSATIRHSERVAKDTRQRGQLAYELEVTLQDQPQWWEALKEGRKVGPRLSATTTSVAADYQQLAEQILDAIEQAESVAP